MIEPTGANRVRVDYHQGCAGIASPCKIPNVQTDCKSTLLMMMEGVQVEQPNIKLSLHIRHPTRDLSPVCAALGLVPTHIWKKGDERQTPKGRTLGGTRDSSYCTIPLGETSRQRLPEKIHAALSLLELHRDLLRELSSTGGEVSFFVGWFLDADTRDYLDWKILSEMAELRIGLDLDLYVPREPQSDTEI